MGGVGLSATSRKTIPGGSAEGIPWRTRRDCQGDPHHVIRREFRGGEAIGRTPGPRGVLVRVGERCLVTAGPTRQKVVR
jgi:hypothetical protein